MIATMRGREDLGGTQTGVLAATCSASPPPAASGRRVTEHVFVGATFPVVACGMPDWNDGESPGAIRDRSVDVPRARASSSATSAAADPQAVRETRPAGRFGGTIPSGRFVVVAPDGRERDSALGRHRRRPRGDRALLRPRRPEPVHDRVPGDRRDDLRGRRSDRGRTRAVARGGAPRTSVAAAPLERLERPSGLDEAFAEGGSERPPAARRSNGRLGVLRRRTNRSRQPAGLVRRSPRPGFGTLRGI